MVNIKWDSEKVYKKIVDTTIRKMNALGNSMVKDIKQSMKPGTGNIYPSRKGKGLHQASKPYYPPAPDTRDLKNSIRQMVWWESNKIILRVGTDVEYSKYLEIGTRNMLPRPFLRPSLERFRPRVVAIIGRDGTITVMPGFEDTGIGVGEGSQTS